MSHLSRSAIQTRFTLVLAGIAKHITSPVSFGGTTYTVALLSAPFQAWLMMAAALATAKAGYHAAVLAEQAAFKAAQTLWVLLQAYCRCTFVGDTATLADFGFAPEKHTVPSPATKAAAAVKAKATREARHTMGKVQKKAVTGASPAPAPAAPPAVTPPAK